MKLYDEKGRLRDTYFEFQKYSAHLRVEFVARQLAISELFRRTINIPGAIIELGVRNGANFFYLARLLEIYNSAQRYDGITSKQLIGFDTFTGFPEIAPEDQSVSSWHEMRVGGVTSERDVFFDDLEVFKQTSNIANRIHVYEGRVEDTLKTFLVQSPGIRISMLVLDVDLYFPTKLALELLWPLVVPGGILIFDEYGFREFPGESLAVDEFLPSGYRLDSFSWCSNPSAYITK